MWRDCGCLQYLFFFISGSNNYDKLVMICVVVAVWCGSVVNKYCGMVKNMLYAVLVVCFLKDLI